jgi:hypothetical protein
MPRWRAARDVPCPPLHVLMALRGVTRDATDGPVAFSLIAVADLPHWLLWDGWVCLGRDPSEEGAWLAWHAAHPDVA